MRYIFVLLVVSVACLGQDPCSVYSSSQGPFYHYASNVKQHTSGNHSDQMVATGYCGYVLDSTNENACDSESDAYMNVYAYETGTLSYLGYHVPAYAAKGGIAASNGGPTTSGSEGAFSVSACRTSNCGGDLPVVDINVGYSGVGASVKFPANQVWEDKFPYTNNCIAETPPSTGGGGGGGQCFCGVCSNEKGPAPDCNWDSPIVIDTTGNGYNFTDPKTECILFDIQDNNKPVCLSWPVAGSGNAWLVLPSDVGVTSSKQLFGNFTPVPKRKAPFEGGIVPITPNPHNGFDVLQGYDNDESLVLDSSNPIRTKLRLWIDNHCYKNTTEVCTSLPEELHTLEEFGITNIGLVYSKSSKVDKWGNEFRYESKLNVDTSIEGINKYGLTKSADRLNRTIYDVYLKIGKGE